MNTHPWLELYPPYMPKEIGKLEHESLLSLWEQDCKKYFKHPVIENMNKTLTYEEVDVLSTNLAAYFQQSCGIKAGERIIIQLPNILQFPIVMIAAMKARLILVNTNPLYTPREMLHQFKDSGATTIVILANFAHHLEKIIKDTAIQNVIVTEIGDCLGGIKKVLTNFVVKRIKKMVPAYNLPQAVTFAQALKIGKEMKLNLVHTKAEDLFCLQYTGGTTGVSKGAKLSNKNILSNIIQIMPVLQNSSRGALEFGNVAIVPLPIYHIYALTATLAFVHCGIISRLVTNPRDIEGFIKILKSPFHAFIGINTLYNALLNSPNFSKINTKHVKICIAGGMALQEVVFERWLEKTNVTITEGYGLSETSPVLTFQISGKEKMGSIGVPVSSTEIQIMDDSGKNLPFGEAGELCARGPQVFEGYWNSDSQNMFHPGGWFKTGDIAVMDKDGYLKIVDRKKDMILVSGFNVYPNEIENVLARHPKVLEVAAVGVKDEDCGEVVKIFIVKKDQSLTEEEIKIFCKENFTGYKRPKHIEFRTELPKSNIGKILRKDLKE